MIGKVFREINFFRGIDKVIFIVSCFFGLFRILKDRTILTMRFIAPVRVRTEGQEILVRNYWEIPFYVYDYDDVLRWIEDDSLLIDIGAHFGEVSYRFLKKSKGFSYLFEVNPHNVRVLRRLFRKENIDNFELFNFGLGSEDKDDFIYLGNPLSYEGSLIGDGGKKVKVQVKRLDGIVLDKVEEYEKIFLKMDVEGYEVSVFEGMKIFLKNLVDRGKKVRFLVEIKDEVNLDKIVDILRGINPKMIFRKVTEEDYLFDL